MSKIIKIIVDAFCLFVEDTIEKNNNNDDDDDDTILIDQTSKSMFCFLFFDFR
jgi:hypothetical protein